MKFTHNMHRIAQDATRIRESDEQVRLLLNFTAEAIYGINTEGKRTFCNPPTASMLGYKNTSQLVAKNNHKLDQHHNNSEKVFDIKNYPISKVLVDGQRIHVADEEFYRSNGTCFPVEYRGHPIKRKAEQEKHKLSHIIEQTSDGVFIIGINGLIEYVNPAFEAMTGFLKHELVGKSSGIINPEHHASAFHNQLWNSINKNGVGICKDNITKLFKEFSQAETTTTRRFGGTGLGLAISRSIIHMMGGDIQVKSELGKGATFTIHIPASQVRACPLGQESYAKVSNS